MSDMTIHPDSPVRRVALEIEHHVGMAGWDQPPRLFALVETERLVAEHPEIAEELAGSAEYTPVEQDDVPRAEFEEFLLQVAWPESVDGVAATVERLTEDGGEVRIVGAALRDGSVHSLVRGRAVVDGSDGELLEGPDLVPGLVAVLRDTLVEALP